MEVGLFQTMVANANGLILAVLVVRMGPARCFDLKFRMGSTNL